MSSNVLHWQCIQGCGACCRLDPGLRGEALEALSPGQRERYLAMVGEDGWCIHYDTGGRRCRIYGERPDFCHVDNLVGLFAGACGAHGDGTGAPPERDSLAIACCLQQIRAEYGGRGRVMRRFRQAIRRGP
ncbi:YkgJ family cysteine cluster protein [Cyanobium sp. NIES-981]|uniref:YkgJ family cysteine cluster protein n=1 Tax=Cyanobium sp. NIES-981 TaxID=1851505 RepID=UPI0007DDEB1C|nr:YkgJ family cysteine cluster protein [Cyanobium sp. NIES-981]SBO41949.1 Fe-S cluster protein [Cyanobium sp. NIES-981]